MVYVGKGIVYLRDSQNEATSAQRQECICNTT